MIKHFYQKNNYFQSNKIEMVKFLSLKNFYYHMNISLKINVFKRDSIADLKA